MSRSRVRGPYARFCERDEVSLIVAHLTLLDFKMPEHIILGTSLGVTIDEILVATCRVDIFQSRM